MHIFSSIFTTALQSTIQTKIWKVLQTTHAQVEKKLVKSKQVIEKLTKYKKTGIANQQNILRIDTTWIINLSKRHLTKFQISFLTKEPKFRPTTKGNVFDIKPDAKEFTRKLKLREKFWGIEYDESSVKVSQT